MKRFLYAFSLLGLFFLLTQQTYAQDTTVTVTATGEVGIGTTSPQALLEVNGNALIRSTGFTGNAGGSGGGLEIRGQSGTFQPSLALDNGTQQWNIVTWGDNALRFVKASGSTFTPLSISNTSFADAVNIGTTGVGIGKANATEMLDVAGNIAVSGTVDGVDISSLSSNYTQFGSLNSSSVTVTSTYTQLGIGTRTFTKQHAGSKIEVYVNSNFGGGTFGGGASGLLIQARVDGSASTIGNEGAVGTTNSEEFISIFAVFQNLPAGSHTVSLWGRVNAGSSSSVIVDPGGWGGKIIVKETW